MNTAKTNTQAAMTIIDDVIDLSVKLQVLRGGGEEVYKRLHSIQRAARNMLSDYPAGNLGREAISHLERVLAMLDSAGQGDIEISNADLQLMLPLMEMLTGAIRCYLYQRVNLCRMAEGEVPA